MAYPKGFEPLLTRLRRDSVEIATKKDVWRTLPGDLTKALGLTHRPIKNPHTRWGFFIGLPERIRTFDLQSRSLTRYPAVPRVDRSR